MGGWQGPKNGRRITREGIEESYLRGLYLAGTIDLQVFEEAMAVFVAGGTFHHEPFAGDWLVDADGVRLRERPPDGRPTRPFVRLERVLG